MPLEKPFRLAALLLLFLPMACETGHAGREAFWEGHRGIVNGQETNYESWQGAVGLFSGMSICTGSLIAPDVVLSAGHCIFMPSQGIDYVSDPESLQVLGGPIMDIYYSEAEQVIAHPKWNGNLGAGSVDLSMIKLKHPIEGIEPYLVRDQENPKVKDQGIVVGYGATKTNDSATAAVHRWGETTVQSVASGRIGSGNPSGLCQGDSGGPLFTQQSEQWVVTGVASFITGFCNAKTGSYSVNVVPNREWIEQTFKELTGRDLPSPLDEPVTTDEMDTASDDSDLEDDTDKDTETQNPEDEDDTGGDVDGTPISGGTGCQAVLPPSRVIPLLWIWLSIS